VSHLVPVLTNFLGLIQLVAEYVTGLIWDEFIKYPHYAASLFVHIYWMYKTGCQMLITVPTFQTFHPAFLIFFNFGLKLNWSGKIQ